MIPERIQALRKKYPASLAKMVPSAQWLVDINELLDAVESSGCYLHSPSPANDPPIVFKTDGAERMLSDGTFVRRGGAPCVHCGKTTISLCPYCHEYVCPDYNRADCGTRHEAKCPKAKEARKCPKK